MMFYLHNLKISEFIDVDIKDTTESSISASYLDCYLNIDNGKLITRLFDKRDDFNFPIVNFQFMSSNIPSAPAYGVYVSQLVRCARACCNYEDFVDIGGSYSPTNCCHRDIAGRSLCQLLKSSVGETMDLLTPTAWPCLNLPVANN